ncbi:MAG TPA: nucleotidyltransferase domain-containing protein [Nocardioides sp.]|nr:nucleotidyltransferase domain-containing protein [Nocardioides sp.]
MQTDLSRYADWMTWLAEQGATDPDVRVVWVGGSAATGGYDEWSDLDIDLLCTPGEADAVHDRLVARAREAFAIDHVWELPKTTWPDGRQCFVNLQARPGALEEPTRIVDLHVSELSDVHRFVDVRRHGTPIVVHDPDGLVELRHDDEKAMSTAIAEGVDQIRQRRATAEWLVNRALRRGQLPEAVHLYLGFGLGPLVRLLRVKHCPWRHDFGLRYLHTDLPADVAARVDALVPGNGVLAEQAAACFTWTDELLA